MGRVGSGVAGVRRSAVAATVSAAGGEVRGLKGVMRAVGGTRIVNPGHSGTMGAARN